MQKLNETTMNMPKAYVVTYKDFEGNEKEYIWNLHRNAKELMMHRIADDIKHFIETGEWVKRNEYKNKRFIVRGEGWNDKVLLNRTQYTFYKEVVRGVAFSIGIQCVKDQAFAKRLLKVARKQAKERDEKYIEKMLKQKDTYMAERWGHENRDGIKRTKQYIDYRMKNDYLHSAAIEYQDMIEEYDMYSILNIEPYEGELPGYYDWWMELNCVG